MYDDDVKEARANAQLQLEKNKCETIMMTANRNSNQFSDR